MLKQILEGLKMIYMIDLMVVELEYFLYVV